MAASATFALKAGLCVRRARLAIVAPDQRHSRRSQADFPLIGLSEFGQPPLWNRWYDTVPGEWRFQYVIWSLLALGTLNMALTVAIRFPFALLVLLGIIVITAIRVPYVLGWVTSPKGVNADWNFQIEGVGWLTDLNHRYEALP